MATADLQSQSGGEGGDDQFILPALPDRPSDGHKGTFGTVLIVGGSDQFGSVMLGAPALVARAALRAGCGLAQIAAPDSIIRQVLSIEPCATGIALRQREKDGTLKPSECAEAIDSHKSRASVLALGPGFGVGFEQQQIIMRLLADDETPIVLDADGLNNLAKVPEFTHDLRAPLVITPHPGEFGRLAEALGMTRSGKGDGAERLSAAREMAQRIGCVVVLKSAGTVVTDGQRIWTCEIREPALATGGSGDVLTGILASMIAQFWKPYLGAGRVTPGMQGGFDLMECAAWAVDIHARCGKTWADESGGRHSGMIASDLCTLIPHVMKK